jgi:hypothetical protein
MQRRFPTLAILALSLSLSLAACEQKAAPPASGSAAAPAAAPAAKAVAAAATPGTIGFELVEAVTVGALQIDVEYKGEGRFVGDADAVACETKIEGALSSYNHIVAEKTLKAAFVAVKGFSGPVRFTECKFQGTAKPEDFKVTVRDASTPDLAELQPAPTVKVVIG